MPPCPCSALSGPSALEPLEGSLLIVLAEVLDATILHVLDRRLLGQPRDDVEDALELPEHYLVHETLSLFLGPHN